MKKRKTESNTINYLLIAIILNICLFISCKKDNSILSPGNGENGDGPLSLNTNPVNIQLFDSYSGESQIKFYWRTGRPYVDPWSTPPPDVEIVRIFMSEAAPDEEFKLILERHRDGDDSTLVENLVNGKIYYFLLTTYTLNDSLIGVSRPLMTSPGTIRDLLVSFTTSQATNPLYVSNITWSPDGQQLALIKNDSEDKPNIHILNIDNLSFEQITNYTSDNYRLLSVAWSPNGETIAFEYTPTSTAGFIDYRIWLISLNDHQSRSITSGRVDSDPTWLSDNKLIFCKGTVGPPNIPELHSVEILNGNNEDTITNDQSIRKYTPQVYPAMDLIVYSGAKVNPHERYLFTISTTGTNHEPLTENIYWHDIHPSWSPNGQEVYFTSNRSGHYEIWSINIITRKIEQITRGLERGIDKFYGRISPDENRIAIIESNSNNEYTLKILSINQLPI